MIDYYTWILGMFDDKLREIIQSLHKQLTCWGCLVFSHVSNQNQVYSSLCNRSVDNVDAKYQLFYFKTYLYMSIFTFTQSLCSYWSIYLQSKLPYRLKLLIWTQILIKLSLITLFTLVIILIQSIELFMIDNSNNV